MSEIDHTGKIVCGRRHSRIDQQLINEAYQLIAEGDERRATAVFGRLTYCLVSVDHGRTWKKWSLCDECIRTQEPPVRVRREGTTGASRCDWCETYNQENFQS